MYIKGLYYFSQLVLTRAVIGHFSAPYFTVRPASIYRCFRRQNVSRFITSFLDSFSE